jgi:hypothetical protein
VKGYLKQFWRWKVSTPPPPLLLLLPLLPLPLLPPLLHLLLLLHPSSPSFPPPPPPPFLLLPLLLLQALQLQRSFRLLNEFIPFHPVSDAVLPVYFHPCYIALYFILPSLFRSSSLSFYCGCPLIYFFFYHAVIWHTMYMSEPS